MSSQEVTASTASDMDDTQVRLFYLMLSELNSPGLDGKRIG